MQDCSEIPRRGQLTAVSWCRAGRGSQLPTGLPRLSQQQRGALERSRGPIAHSVTSGHLWGFRETGQQPGLPKYLSTRLRVATVEPSLSERRYTRGLHTPFTVRLFNGIDPVPALTAHYAGIRTKGVEKC